MVTEARTAYEIVVTLNDIEPPVWRRLIVPDAIQLPAVHTTLQIAMGWTDTHLHQFLIGNQRLGIPDPEFDDGTIDEAPYQLDQLLTRENTSLLYEYDFGDGWEHTVTLEHTRPLESSETLPRCTAGERGCPPEDVGGPFGYMSFLEQYRDRTDPEHQAVVEWAGYYFDPESFAIDEVNKRLSQSIQRV